LLNADNVMNQIGADAINGLQDMVVDLINLGLKVVSFVSGGSLHYQLTSPDWSQDLFVHEPPIVHSLSKMIGGQVLLSIVTLGMGSALEGLTAGEEVAEITTLEREVEDGEEVFANGSKLCTDGVNCFVAGTEVITGINADGTYIETAIQNIKVGDYVLSRNQFDPNGPEEKELVTAVQQHTAVVLQDVTLVNTDGSTQVIQTTPDHPFYVEGLGFTNAQDLYAGEMIEEASGGYASVVSSISEAHPQGVTVYNFTVANDHTYFVDQGGDAVWVHNVTCSQLRSAAREAFAEAYPRLWSQGEALAEDLGENVLEVHHRIPLMYRNLFGGDQFANGLSNLIGLSKNVHAEVSGLWTSFRLANKEASAAEVLQFAQKIDQGYGSFFNTLRNVAVSPAFR
jgi:hypothetical protein